MLEQTRLLVAIVGLTVLSGVADSQGFLHAARVWRDGQLVLAEMAKSALGFGVGIVLAGIGFSSGNRTDFLPRKEHHAS